MDEQIADSIVQAFIQSLPENMNATYVMIYGEREFIIFINGYQYRTGYAYNNKEDLLDDLNDIIKAANQKKSSE